jgi:sterol 3beta-glucosyltransferase
VKITLLTYGSRGDVEPFIALAQGLIRAGHAVRLVAPQLFVPLLGSTEIEFFGLPGDPGQLVQGLVDEAGRNQWRMIFAMGDFVLPLALEVNQIASQAAEGADLIVHSFLLTSLGYELARRQGIPDISAQLFPVFCSTSEFPAPTFPPLPLGDTYRRLTHQIVNQVFWQGSRFLYKLARRKHPVLPPLTGWPFDLRSDRPTPILYAFSPSVVPHPQDWPAHAHTTGYWFPQNTALWNPDQAIMDYLVAGPKPVVIAFGSTVSRRLGGIVTQVLEALTITGQRGILVGSGFEKEHIPPEVYSIANVPYEWLFPRAAAVVHHGGAGTTGKGLLAGVPNVVIPFTSDQPFWGNRVHILGAGPKPLAPGSISIKKLAAAIDATINDVAMRDRAAQTGRAIAQEDGVSQAVAIIERYARL